MAVQLQLHQFSVICRESARLFVAHTELLCAFISFISCSVQLINSEPVTVKRQGVRYNLRSRTNERQVAQL